MKKSVFRILTLVGLTTLSYSAFAQQAFEGIIEFKKKGTTDTTNYVYYVKGNKVRLDEIGVNTHSVSGTFLIDLDAKTQLALNYERKLYMDKNSASPPVIKGVCDVKKGKTVKTLQGYKCQEYVVANNDENTKITYYLADDKFLFFPKLLNILNRKDKSSSYFLQIKDAPGTFPMQSVQTDISGTVTGSLEVTKITKKIVDPNLFEIPKGYTKFEK